MAKNLPFKEMSSLQEICWALQDIASDIFYQDFSKKEKLPAITVSAELSNWPNILVVPTIVILFIIKCHNGNKYIFEYQ